MAGFRRTDLPGGDYKFLVPSASLRSWVYVRGDDDAIELTGASIERAPGSPMSEFPLVDQPHYPPNV